MRIRSFIALAVLATQALAPVSGAAGAASAAAPRSVSNWLVGLCTPTRGIALDVDTLPTGRTAVLVGDFFFQRVDILEGRPRITATSTAVGGNEVSLLPDGRTAIIASTRVGAVSVVDLSGSGIRQAFRIRLANVRGIALSPDGRYLYALNSVGPTAHFLRVFSVSATRTLREIRAVRLPYSPRSIAVSQDGERAAVSSRDRLVLISLHNPAVPVLRPTVKRALREADAVTFTPDGGTVFVADRAAGGGAEVVRVNAFSNAAVAAPRVASVLADAYDLEVGPRDTTLWTALKGPIGQQQVELTTLHLAGAVEHRLHSTLPATALSLGVANSRNYALVVLRTHRACLLYG